MTDFAEWSTRHAVTFGFLASEGPMVAEWVEHFARWGFAPDELAAASEFLARGGAPSWRPDHFAALREAVLKARQPPPPPREPAPEDPLGTCRDCGGTGRVVMPAAGLRTAAGNVIRSGTTAVYCGCALGRWQAARPHKAPGGKEIRLLTLEEYERLRPGWRAEAQEEREAQRLAAEAACARLDEGLRKVLGKARAMRHGREPGEEG